MQAAKRILIIEDEMLIALDIEDALTDAGFTVAGVAARVEHAIKHLADGAVDAVVMDLNLSGEPGEAVVQHLERLRIPVVILSGYGEEGVPERLRSAPVLSKPFEAKRLITALNALSEV